MRYTDRDVKQAFESLATVLEAAAPGSSKGMTLQWGNSSYHRAFRVEHPTAGTIADGNLLGTTRREATIGLRAVASGVALGAALEHLRGRGRTYDGLARRMLERTLA